MKLQSQIQLSPRLIHLVPFLSVVLLLLTFFLLGSSMVMQSGVRVHPPASTSLLEPMPKALVLTLTAGRNPQLYVNEQPVTLEALPEILKTRARDHRQVLIRADELAAHGWVLKVTQIAFEAGYEVAQAAVPPETDALNPMSP